MASVAAKRPSVSPPGSIRGVDPPCSACLDVRGIGVALIIRKINYKSAYS